MENAGAHQTHNCCDRLDHANVPLRPIRVKRHLPREKEWSTIGCEPIVREVHSLIRWYDRRDHRVQKSDHGGLCGLIAPRGRRNLVYTFQATTSVCVKQKNASALRHQDRQAVAMPAKSERVANPYSKDF